MKEKQKIFEVEESSTKWRGKSNLKRTEKLKDMYLTKAQIVNHSSTENIVTLISGRTNWFVINHIPADRKGGWNIQYHAASQTRCWTNILAFGHEPNFSIPLVVHETKTVENSQGNGMRLSGQDYNSEHVSWIRPTCLKGVSVEIGKYEMQAVRT